MWTITTTTTRPVVKLANRCVKCGSDEFTLSYNKSDDTMTTTCYVCGYTRTTLPKDREDQKKDKSQIGD